VKDDDLVIGRERSQEFIACLRLLRDLDRLIASSRGDGPEADEVRNQMEVPYATLSDGEGHLLDLVSVAIRQADPKGDAG
jgi:hypothetical protein